MAGSFSRCCRRTGGDETRDEESCQEEVGDTERRSTIHEEMK
ncbi:unnamed protein product [Linum tenue]|uniref:Uncharacterized protein n=1 Tax=Linum tenue TaxID=586396 RepID=A0AAV0IXN6_9ROSI|nr:unnamed protein product [Linum tenue]